MGAMKYHLLEQRPTITEFSGESKLINEAYIVDIEYYEWLSNFKWHLGTTGYAMVPLTKNYKPYNVKMHRLIVDAQPGQIVDHINRNKLDNRVANLRFVTKSENALNSERTAKARYYTFDKNRNKWAVQKDKKHYGRFDTEEEARAFVLNNLMYSAIPNNDR